MPRRMQRGHDREAYLETIDDSPTYNPRRGNLERHRRRVPVGTIGAGGRGGGAAGSSRLDALGAAIAAGLAALPE